MPFRSDPTDQGPSSVFRPVVAPARWTLGWWANLLFILLVFVALPLVLIGLFVWLGQHPPSAL